MSPTKNRLVDKATVKAKAANVKKRNHKFKKPKTTKGTPERVMADYIDYLESWLDWFVDDYTRIRRAVCNLDKRIFDNVGFDDKYRFCNGGPGDDIADPPQPPKW